MNRLSRIHRRLRKRLLAIRYQPGNDVECPHCGWTGSQFLPAGRDSIPNRMCPRCGSLERYRMLLLYLRNFVFPITRPTLIMEIAPIGHFKECLTNISGITYLSSDLRSRKAMFLSDLTEMGAKNNSVDLLICLHVLEHIKEDKKAIAEIERLLKPGGFALVMVPLRGQETLERPDIQPDEFERFYGQFDHVRYYGMDIEERFRGAGLYVEAIDLFSQFTMTELQRFALLGDDQYLFKVSKTQI